MSETNTPPATKSSAWKWVVGCGCLAVVAAVGLVVAVGLMGYRTVERLVEPGKLVVTEFLTDLSKKDYAAAYALCSSRLQKASNVAQLTEAVEKGDPKVLGGGNVSVSAFFVNANQTDLRGTFQNGPDVGYFHVVLIPEEGHLRVQLFQVEKTPIR